MLTYEQSGVNIDEGNRAVSLIKNKIKETYDKNVLKKQIEEEEDQIVSLETELEKKKKDLNKKRSKI